VLLQVQ